MFQLVRFFFFTSSLAVIVVAATLVFHRQDEIGRLIAFAEGQNVILARSLANAIWPRFSTYINSASDLEGNVLNERPEARQIGAALKAVTAGLPILKVKIYNLDGITVFSSERVEIGEDKSTNVGFFAAARDGTPASQLTSRDRFSTFEGIALNRDAVESYLPIRRADGQIEGVFELYSDVTPLLAKIQRSTTELIFGATLVFVISYGTLFLIVRRADRTIRRQYADISDKNSALTREIGERRRFEDALRRAHDELEQRVADRTQALTDEIAERKRAEDQARSHRNELARVGAVVVMGEMATSLAHELNQPLTVISGCAQMCLDKLTSKAAKPQALRDPVEQIAEQAQRANDIIRRVRGFIAKGDEERGRIDVNGVIHDLLNLLQSDAREHESALEFEVTEALPPVWADTIQIQQVVLNLAHNAFEAMAESKPARRCLTIRTSALADGTVEVAVGDTGRGISAAVLDQVFEPFYTTKPSGLGMGLAISRSIIEGHGGRLWATSDGENGTVFRFVLPVAASVSKATRRRARAR
jgi:signal transduction histidine kinase